MTTIVQESSIKKLTLEQRMKKVALSDEKIRKTVKDISSEVHSIFLDYQMEGRKGGFYSWASKETGIAFGSLHRYVQIGMAIRAGVDGTPDELHAAAKLLADGDSVEEIQEAVENGTVANKSKAVTEQQTKDARENLSISSSAAEVFREQVERVRKLAGEEVGRDELELLTMRLLEHIPEKNLKVLVKQELQDD